MSARCVADVEVEFDEEVALVFTCGEPAVAVFTVICQHGATDYPLCAEHAGVRV